MCQRRDAAQQYADFIGSRGPSGTTDVLGLLVQFLVKSATYVGGDEIRA